MDNWYEKIYQSLDRGEYPAARRYIAKLAQHEPVEGAWLLVSSFIEQGDWLEAMTAWQKLAALLPDDFFTLFLHARILFGQGRYVSAYREVNKIVVPHNKRQGYGEKIANLRGQCCRMLGKTAEAAAAYLEAAQLAAEPSLQALEYSNYLFNLHYSGSHEADFLRREAAKYGEIFGGYKRYSHHGERKAGELIRIGYMASDFRRHVLLCFCYNLLTAYDRERFAVYVYMLGTEDEYSQKVKRQVAVWRNLQGVSASKAAEAIHEDQVDILVDLAGHTKGNGLPIMACRPAPIQISGIGYFASTGLKEMDYFLGDAYLDIDDTQREFVEQLLILPQSHFCYRPFQVAPLPEVMPYKRHGYITFGCFNNFAKVTDEVLQVWGEILKRLPDSHLLLKAAVFDGGELEGYTLDRLKQAGLPMDRVECRGISDNYLTEYGDMDIALDTFPYPGGGTSCDALYMGRPLITLAGGSHGERFGYSLLMNLGLGELAAHTEEEYISRAVMLAGDIELLQGLQENLRSMMQRSSLMDSRLYLQTMENAYKMLVERENESIYPNV